MANQVPLPITEGRLSQSCAIYTTSNGNVDPANLANGWLTTNDLQASSAVDPVSFLNSVLAMLGASKPIGSIEKIDISQTRDVERIYSIGSYAFEPYRMVPKSVKTKLTLSNVVLNSGDFLSAVGFSSWNLYYQQAPFIIRQDLVNPRDQADVTAVLYFDCWISNNPCTFDLTGTNNNLVRQQVEVECGRVMASNSTYIGNAAKLSISKPSLKF